ncbi:Uncharacterized conserved protein YndB, AHSA1/START domain [Raineyella antarctica]|uniref:Uncharacterized conserved protein YndB, AHSA1/START domain n=2 Tax=Raineyella antarctica TaxID=1577474 RepID=A0A1G6HH22_9ACTN|nr:Uncharacterized conserved protein YndB, AHSA1/START domain [Raineyella antarctica]
MYAMTVTRHVQAPRPVVYQALVDPLAIARWRVPDGMVGLVHEFDARPGGRLRISLTYVVADGVGKSGERTDTYQGTFVRLVPDVQVIETSEFETEDTGLRGTMTMTTTLTDAGEGTDVTISYEGIPDGVPAHDNEIGTRMALDKLARLVET